MPIKSKYLFVASMDVDPDKEALFHEVYDTEHVPNLLKVPGVHAVTRLEGRRRCGRSPATGATRCTGSGEPGVIPWSARPRRRGPGEINKRTGFRLSRE